MTSAEAPPLTDATTPAEAPAEPGWRDARRLLRGPLRVLVTGQAFGQAADGLAQIAFAQLVVFDIGKGASPGRIAGVLAATLLPFTLVGPLAGVLIDRWDRRRTLIAMSAVRAALGIGATFVAISRSEVLAYVGVLLLLSSSRFVLAGKGAVLPRTVAPGELVTANAVSSVVGMVAAFAGAVLGSAFVTASSEAGFLLATVGYLLAGATFRRLPHMGGGRQTHDLASRLRQVGRELVEGIELIATTSGLRRPLTAVWAHRLLLGAGFIVLVLVADERYHVEAGGYGLALAVTGVAAFAGTVAAPPLARRWRPEAILPLTFVPPALAALVAGFAPNLATLLVALAVVALSFQCLKVLTDALVGRRTADAVRGRVFAAYDVLYNVAFVLAGLLMVPLWERGRERPLSWCLAAAFGVGWALLARATRRAALPSAGAEIERAHPWRWRAAAFLAGGVPVLAFPAPSWWWLAWVGLVPWLLVVRRAPTAREAATSGWAAAAGFLVGMHHWLLPTTGPFLAVVAAALGLLWVPWSIAAWWLLSGRPCMRRTVGAMLALPTGWVLIETARSWSSLGGPWGLLGASQWKMPALLSSASVGGVWLVGLLIVLSNVAVTTAVIAASPRVRVVAALVAAAAVGVGPLGYALQSPPQVDRVLRVAVVQPGVVHGPQARLARGEQLTRDLPDRRYDLVVWGESSVGFDLFSRPDLLARLTELSAQRGADLLVNVDARDPDGAIRKTSVLLDSRGVVARYDKMRLVPFGEYVPFRKALGWLSVITKAAAEDRHRGRRIVVMRSGDLAFTPLVCFESAFPDMSRRAARSGAQLLVFQSATSTFQGSWAPAQHATLAAVRAVETGRPALHATLTGTTAAFDSQGHRLAWLDTHHRGTVVVSVPLAARTTAYVRYGDWVPIGSLAVVVAVSLLGLRHRRVVRALRTQHLRS
jgi:apolipoprotein N-acyltransferase